MSSKPIVLNPYIKRLMDEGFGLEFQPGYLLVHDIPYVNAQCLVRYGTLVTDLDENVGEILPPKDHLVWFCGEYPCHKTGAPIEAIRNVTESRFLWDGFQVQHSFSNKPPGGNYPDHYTKVTSYIRIISHEARALDPTADPCTFKVLPPSREDSVFRYHDTASSRADILALTGKLEMDKVALIGLGGTGAYVLDLVAKTPPREVHLFDGDSFLQHNAFRAPGAASEAVLGEKLLKVTYYARIYDAMRRGIVPHPEYVTEANLGGLAGFDFVFLCVDKGPIRKLITDFLQVQGIPFIDAGMDLLLGPGAENLFGTCRVTMGTPAKSDHIPSHVPMVDDLVDDLYRKAIQVADLNALNAALAVIKWKQFCGFYQDCFQPHHLTYSFNSQSLTRDVMNQLPGE